MVAPRPSLEKLISEKGLSPTVEKFRECIHGFTLSHLGLGCKSFTFSLKLRSIIGALAYLYPDQTFERAYPWPIFITRLFRQFNADVLINCPKDRTLMNYNIKEGWPRLAQFLEIECDAEGQRLKNYKYNINRYNIKIST